MSTPLKILPSTNGIGAGIEGRHGKERIKIM
jgi:hypothetical protein